MVKQSKIYNNFNIPQKFKNSIDNYTISKNNLPIILPKILKILSNKNLLLNLNFPNCKQEDLKGQRY